MRNGMLPELGWLFTVLQSQDMNPNQADFKIHTNPTAPPMSLCRTLIYIPWDFLNSLLLAFLVRNLPVFLLPCSLKKKNLLIILHSWNLSTYLTRETQELKGMECGNSELKASSRLFLILFTPGWTVQLFCLATFLFPPHPPTPPELCLAGAQHCLSPIPPGKCWVCIDIDTH